ncbi:MAG: hypothetical protein IKL62_05790 [Clostridia bacterium]|nr:hypothetical protein [Clostridia bacterium]
MKKIFAILLVLCAMMAVLCACGGDDGEKAAQGICQVCGNKGEIYHVEDRKGQEYNICSDCKKIFEAAIYSEEGKCEDCGKEGMITVIKYDGVTYRVCNACRQKLYSEVEGLENLYK